MPLENLPDPTAIGTGQASSVTVAREARHLLVRLLADTDLNVFQFIAVAVNATAEHVEPWNRRTAVAVTQAMLDGVRGLPAGGGVEMMDKLNRVFGALDWQAANYGERGGFEAFRIDLGMAQVIRREENRGAGPEISGLAALFHTRQEFARTMARWPSRSFFPLLALLASLTKNNGGAFGATTKGVERALAGLIAQSICDRRILSPGLTSKLRWYESQYGDRLGFECLAEDVTLASTLREHVTNDPRGCLPYAILGAIIGVVIWWLFK